MKPPGQEGTCYGYLRDPVFLTSAALYLLNRLLLKPLTAGDGGSLHAFLHGHLNDLLCIPFCLPPLLLIERKLGLRGHDGPPTRLEIGVSLAIWTAVFEWAAPRFFHPFTVGDPGDIVAYAAGPHLGIASARPGCRPSGGPCAPTADMIKWLSTICEGIAGFVIWSFVGLWGGFILIAVIGSFVSLPVEMTRVVWFSIALVAGLVMAVVYSWRAFQAHEGRRIPDRESFAKLVAFALCALAWAGVILFLQIPKGH
jgi:hypothetical protein